MQKVVEGERICGPVISTDSQPVRASSGSVSFQSGLDGNRKADEAVAKKLIHVQIEFQQPLYLQSSFLLSSSTPPACLQYPLHWVFLCHLQGRLRNLRGRVRMVDIQAYIFFVIFGALASNSLCNLFFLFVLYRNLIIFSGDT